jgi:hypothetical protein
VTVGGYTPINSGVTRPPSACDARRPLPASVRDGQELTTIALEKLKPGPTRREIPDGRIGGLYFIVQPPGNCLGFPISSGRQAAQIHDRPPSVSLKTARERAGEARDKVVEGKPRRRFIEAGVCVEYIDCDTALFEREEIFDRFRSGETKLICNVAVLDTGLDLDVRCIIDARPTRSRIRFVQTIGRGLRPGEGKDHLIILDHAGNH